MNTATAQRIETPDQAGEIIEINSSIVKFGTTEEKIQAVEKYADFKITDAKTDKEARGVRKTVNGMITAVDDRRKEIDRNTNAEGKAIEARLLPVKTNLNTVIKAREEATKKAKAEKAAAEEKEKQAIADALSGLKKSCAAGMEYGLNSETILDHLAALTVATPEKSIYQESLPDAWATIKEAIPQVQGAYERAVKFEADQKTQAELEAANKAEADRLAKEKAAQEAEKKKLEDDRKALEQKKTKAEADEKAKQETEAKRLADLDKREQVAAWAAYATALDNEWFNEAYAFNRRVNWAHTMAIFHDVDMAERCREAYFLQIANVWDEAHRVNSQMDLEKITLYNLAWNEAIEHNAQLDLGQAMADDAEAALIEARRPDKEKLLAFADNLDGTKFPELKTIEAALILEKAEAMLNTVVEAIRVEADAL